ncbi:MAG TPA: glycosyltransferase [Phycisphaerae bacterium]|nr:glycosyltransferase [Phycisphaerae bacterium]
MLGRTDVIAQAVFPASKGVARAIHITHVLASISPSTGGPATVTARLAAAQAARGHRVTIISSLHTSSRRDFDRSTARIPGFERVHLLLSPWITPLRRWFGMRLHPLYEMVVPFSDVMHLHGVWEPMLVFAAACARRHNIPYILRPCGMLEPWNLQQRAWKKRVALALTHRKMLNGAAFLHTLNEDEYRFTGPLRLRPPQLVIPNAVFLDEVDDDSGEEEFKVRFRHLRGKPCILFLGRAHYKKGLDLLAEAFAAIAPRHPTAQLLVVGPDGGSLGDFMHRIENHKLSDRVHTPGSLYGAVKFAAYRSATCFALPSRQEGFSLAITEALATGTPVAISENCHFPEVATAGAGKVTPLTVEATAAALDEILSASPEERQKMGDAGRQLVERNYTWDRVAELTLNAYASVMPGVASRVGR